MGPVFFSEMTLDLLPFLLRERKKQIKKQRNSVMKPNRPVQGTVLMRKIIIIQKLKVLEMFYIQNVGRCPHTWVDQKPMPLFTLQVMTR